MGPGGISRSLRNIPVLVGIGRDMEEGCPDAWMLNITNPMTCLTRSVCRETSIKTVGLCHEVGNFCMDVAIAFGEAPHLDPAHGGRRQPLPRHHRPRRRRGRRPRHAAGDGGASWAGWRPCGPAPCQPEAEPFTKADFARRHALKLTLLDRYGALPGAGDRHVAEFIPSALTEASGWGQSLGLRPHPHRRAARSTRPSTSPRSTPSWPGRPRCPTWDSGEIVAPVIDSLLTGTHRELPRQPAQRRAVPRPAGRRRSSRPCASSTATACAGRDAAQAPAAITEWVRRQVAVQELTVEAAVTGDRGLARQAFALDPLAGRGDLRATEAMADELLAGHRRAGCPNSRHDPPMPGVRSKGGRP